MADPMVCTPKALPRAQWVAAAETAATTNPANFPALARLALVNPRFKPTPEAIAVVVTKYWGPKGVKLTVGFLDAPPSALKTKILAHMNAWAQSANVQFAESNDHPQVRIARNGGQQGGYWSYVGTDILHIPASRADAEPGSVHEQTPDSEFHRVVRHETGHTLGFPHEHMRKALVAQIDPQKAIAYFRRTQGWTPAMTRAQVLTPLEDSSIRGAIVDPKSIMCYQIPGVITKTGKPIVGGLDIDASDFAFAATIYPK